MREMELFVDIINEQEANNILMYFQENIPGKRKNSATLEEKKRYIKRVFASKTPKMMKVRRKNRADPFYSYINKYHNKKAPNLSFENSIIKLKELRGNIPDHIRYSLLLLDFPNEFRSNLDLIEENIKNNKDPLDIYEIYDEDELKVYIRKTRKLISDNNFQEFIKQTIEYFSEEEKEKFRLCHREIKSYTFINYYKDLDLFIEKYGLHISNLAYVSINLEEDKDILLLLIFEAIISIVKNNGSKKVIEMTKDFELIQENYKYKVENLEALLKNKENDIEEMHKSVIKSKDIVTRLKINNQSLEEELIQLKKSATSLEDENNDLRIQMNEIIKRDRLKLEEELEKREHRINKYEIIKKQFLSQISTDTILTDGWGIICSNKFMLARDMFQEVNIAFLEDHKECNLMLKNKNIQKIYFIMNHLTTKKYNYFKNIIEKLGKDYELKNIYNLKEFIEWIGYLKNSKREEIEQ